MSGCKVLNFVYDETAEWAVTVNFDANAFFTEGTAIPSEQEVLQVLQDADYGEYIGSYVWNAEPAETDPNRFFDTMEVQYMARIQPALRQYEIYFDLFVSS